MAHNESLRQISIPAGASLSGLQYCFAKIDNTGRAVGAGEGGRVAGILQDTTTTIGAAVPLAISGVSKIVCGGSVAAGDSLSPDSTNRATTVGSADDLSYGIALEAGTIGVIIEMLIQPIGKS